MNNCCYISVSDIIQICICCVSVFMPLLVIYINYYMDKKKTIKSELLQCVSMNYNSTKYIWNVISIGNNTNRSVCFYEWLAIHINILGILQRNINDKIALLELHNAFDKLVHTSTQNGAGFPDMNIEKDLYYIQEKEIDIINKYMKTEFSYSCYKQ